MDFELMHDLPHQSAVLRHLWMEVTHFEAAADRVDVSRADFGRFLKRCCCISPAIALTISSVSSAIASTSMPRERSTNIGYV